MRFFLILLLVGSPVLAQDSDLEAERRTLEAERRTLEAERRALEAERRREPGRRAAAGGSAPSVDPCIAADVQRQRACAESAGNALSRPPQCADAVSKARQACGR